MNEWAEFLRRGFDSLLTQSANLLPRLLVAVALVLAGVALAFVVQALVRGILRRAGLDRVADRTGVGQFLHGLGYVNPASHLAGFAVFWTVFALFLLSSADAFGLPGVSSLIAGLISRLPAFALAALLILVGFAFARRARRLVEELADRSRLLSARPLGAAAYYLVAALSIVIALGGLGIDFTIVIGVVLVILASVGFGLALSVGLGSRDVARNTIDGIYARRQVRTGDRIRVGDVQGEVTGAGDVSITLSDGQKTWLVPYEQLLRSVVEVVERASDD